MLLDYEDCYSPEQEFLEIMKDENREYRERIRRASAYFDLLVTSLCDTQRLDLDRLKLTMNIIAKELDCDVVSEDLNIGRPYKYDKTLFWHDHEKKLEQFERKCTDSIDNSR